MDRPNVYFLGLATEKSASRRIFPAWAEAIGWSASLVGVDLPQETDCDGYRTFLAQLKGDKLCAGAQVTVHKVGLYRCLAADFDDLDDDARSLGEVGGISVRQEVLAAFSPDMLALSGELEEILAKYSAGRKPGEMVILGGGGAGRAIALASARLGNAAFSKITVTEQDDEVKGDLEQHLTRKFSEIGWSDFRIDDAGKNDDIVGSAASGSFIVNATGLGKDAAGSPISRDTLLPRDSVAWDLNYHGDLAFLTHARQEASARQVVVRDGWSFFLRNWYACLTRLADRAPSVRQFERFCMASDSVRPRSQF